MPPLSLGSHASRGPDAEVQTGPKGNQDGAVALQLVKSAEALDNVSSE